MKLLHVGHFEIFHRESVMSKCRHDGALGALENGTIDFCFEIANGDVAILIPNRSGIHLLLMEARSGMPEDVTVPSLFCFVGEFAMGLRVGEIYLENLP